MSSPADTRGTWISSAAIRTSAARAARAARATRTPCGQCGLFIPSEGFRTLKDGNKPHKHLYLTCFTSNPIHSICIVYMTVYDIH